MFNLLCHPSTDLVLHNGSEHGLLTLTLGGLPCLCILCFCNLWGKKNLFTFPNNLHEIIYLLGLL